MTEQAKNAVVATDDPATVRLDVQDPLPETNWFWRRVFTFVLSLVSVGLIWYGFEVMTSLQDSAGIFALTRYMIGVHVLLITYYMVAPSAEQIVKLIQAAKLLQSGVTMTRTAATETPAGGRAEITTTAATETPVSLDEEDAAPRSRS